MNAAMVVTLFDYTYWATDHVLAAAAHLDAQHWVRVPPGHTVSLQGVLVHVLSVERLWRLRLATRSTPEHLRPTDFADAATLRQVWHDEEVAMRGHVSELSERDLGDAVTFRRGSGELSEAFIRWQLLMQCVTHGVSHRSEAAALLTAWGRSPGDLDFLLYLLEPPERSAYRL